MAIALSLDNPFGLLQQRVKVTTSAGPEFLEFRASTEPALRIEPMEWPRDLLYAYVGQTVTVPWRLTNTGAETQTVAGIAVHAEGFSVTHACPGTLLPGQACSVDLHFAPTSQGYAGGSVEVLSPGTWTNFALFSAWGVGFVGDLDFDGVPNAVEMSEGLNPVRRDNDVQANARLFAMQQYRDFLEREGDPVGVQFWTSSIESGGFSRAEVIERFFALADKSEASLVRLYFASLMRVPDHQGFSFWAQELRSGKSVLAIAEAFADSSEFRQRFPSTEPVEFVRTLYRNILGREPDPGGAAFWLTALTRGEATRGQMLLAFSESAEFSELTSEMVDMMLLHRRMTRYVPQDPPAFMAAVQRVESGGTAARLAWIEDLVTSLLYRCRFMDNGCVVVAFPGGGR